MDILAATSAAFIAGIVEGRSVLKHYCENDEKSSGSEQTQSLLVPSLVYGTLSLPLTVIGSSPSVELVSRFSQLEIPEPRTPVMAEHPKDASSEDIHQYEPTIRRMKLGLPSNGELDGQNEDKLTNPNGGRNVLQMREENRRALAATHEKKLAEKAIDSANAFNALTSHVQGTHRGDYRGQVKGGSSVAPPILGKTLPTTVAENMRRARILLIGWGAVSATVLYQKYQRERNDDKKGQIVHSQQGKNLAAVQKYMQCTGCNAGVAMRIMTDHQELNEVKRTICSPRKHPINFDKMDTLIPCSLPIICSAQQTLVAHEDIPVWSIGDNANDWLDIPFDKRMFFENIDGSKQFVILESITSTSLLGGVISQQRRYLKQGNERQSILQAEISSRMIQNALKVKFEGSVGVTHIIVGTTAKHVSDDGPFDVLPTDRIRLNSMDAVASKIVQSVHLALSAVNDLKKPKDSKQTENTDFHNHMSQSTATKNVMEANKSSSNFLLKAIDTVGMQIHNAGRKVVSAATNTVVDAVDSVGRQVRKASQIVIDTADNVGILLIKTIKRSPNYKGTIHVLSDDLELVSWAKSIMAPRDFQIIWHDVRRHNYTKPLDQKEFDNKSTDIFLVLCTTDACTIHTSTVLATMLPIEQTNKIISVVEKVSSCDTLHILLNAENEMIAEPICVALIHEELIANAKTFLISDKLEPNN